MEIITQKEVLKTILPEEIVEEYELEEIIENDVYVEFVMIEINKTPKNKNYEGEKIEIKRYTFERLQTYTVKGKQCRITLKKKRWLIQETRKTITSKVNCRAENMKIPKEFADYLKEVIEMQVTDIPRIARIMRLCPKTLEKWYRKYLTDMEEVAVENIVIAKNMGTKLKIDEVCLHKGDFWTILSNAETKKAIAIIKGTKVKELVKQIEIIPFRECLRVEEITMDMSNSFDWIARTCFPNAKQIIDRFHVQKLVYDDLQSVRVKERKIAIREYQELKDKKEKLKKYENGDTKRQLLARSRGLLFKTRESWTNQQKERARILFREFPNIQKSYELAQRFKAWYDKKYKKHEKPYDDLEKWFDEVKQSGCTEFNTTIETIKRHRIGILNYFRDRSTNAFAESMNAKIKLFKTLVRGVRNPRYFVYRLSTYIT